MARDNNLPFARSLSRVRRETRTPVVPAVVTGVLAAIILLLNINLPRIIETLCSVAVIWANLAYLMVTFPLLIMRLRGWPRKLEPTASGPRAPQPTGAWRIFRLGRWGIAINAVAVVWGVVLVVNMSWPRAEIYGTDPWGRFAAVLSTGLLLGLGGLYYLAVPAAADRHPARPRGGRDTRCGTDGPRRPCRSRRTHQPVRSRRISGPEEGRHAMLKLRRKPRESKRPPSREAGRHHATDRAPAVPGLVRPRLHGSGADPRGDDRRAPRPRRPRRVPDGDALDVRGHDRRRHRRHLRPHGPDQGSRPQLRRPPARRPDRLPDLHLPAPAPDLAGEPPARPARRPGSSSPWSPAPTGSARSTSRPTTATSWASPRSGTWWRCTSTSCRSAPGPRSRW